MKKFTFHLLLIFLIQQSAFCQDNSLPLVDVRVRYFNKYLDYVSFPTRTVSQLKDYKPTKSKEDQYGGWSENKVEARGFYYTKKIGDRWWIIDPEGNYFIHKALCHIAPGKGERNKAALLKKFGDEKKWESETHKKVIEYGFNGAGSWSSHNLIRPSEVQKKTPLAYTPNWHLLFKFRDYKLKKDSTFKKKYRNESLFILDPEFEKFCDDYMAQNIGDLKNDKNLLGHFSDNEIPFHAELLDIGVLMQDKNDPVSKAAWKFLNDRKIGVEYITDSLKWAFAIEIVERYYSVISKIMKKHDPNHLYIGSRLMNHQSFIPELTAVVGKYSDIVTCNYYSRWSPDKKEMNMWARVTEKPFMVTEFYIKGEDTEFKNMTGMGWNVKTQNDRGMFYQNFVLGLLENKNCVGWHWFRYLDNDPTEKGADPSNIDSNKGIVDNDYNFYMPLVNKMTELNTQAYDIIKYFDK